MHNDDTYDSLPHPDHQEGTPDYRAPWPTAPSSLDWHMDRHSNGFAPPDQDQIEDTPTAADLPPDTGPAHHDRFDLNLDLTPADPTLIPQTGGHFDGIPEPEHTDHPAIQAPTPTWHHDRHSQAPVSETWNSASDQLPHSQISFDLAETDNTRADDHHPVPDPTLHPRPSTESSWAPDPESTMQGVGSPDGLTSNQTADPDPHATTNRESDGHVHSTTSPPEFGGFVGFEQQPAGLRPDDRGEYPVDEGNRASFEQLPNAAELTTETSTEHPKTDLEKTPLQNDLGNAFEPVAQPRHGHPSSETFEQGATPLIPDWDDLAGDQELPASDTFGPTAAFDERDRGGFQAFDDRTISGQSTLNRPATIKSTDISQLRDGDFGHSSQHQPTGTAAADQQLADEAADGDPDLRDEAGELIGSDEDLDGPDNGAHNEGADPGPMRSHQSGARSPKTLRKYDQVVRSMMKASVARRSPDPLQPAVVSPLEVVQDFLDDRARISKNTFVLYRSALLEWVFKLRATSDDCASAYRKLAATKPGDGHADSGPTGPKRKPAEKRNISEEELRILITELDTMNRHVHWGSRVSYWIQAGLAAGARPSEWVGASWLDDRQTILCIPNGKLKSTVSIWSIVKPGQTIHDVEAENPELLVPGSRYDESKKIRNVEIDPKDRLWVNLHMGALNDFLDAAPPDQRDKRYQDYYNISREVLRKACRRAFEDKLFPLYVMRSQFASNKKAEMPLDEVSALMGHESSGRTTMGSYGGRAAAHKGKGVRTDADKQATAQVWAENAPDTDGEGENDPTAADSAGGDFPAAP